MNPTRTRLFFNEYCNKGSVIEREKNPDTHDRPDHYGQYLVELQTLNKGSDQRGCADWLLEDNGLLEKSRRKGF